MMTFEQFQATGRDVPDLQAYRHIYAQMGYDRAVPGRVYQDELFIEGVAGTYCLTIANEGWQGADLERMERALYDFAVGEGYIA